MNGAFREKLITYRDQAHSPLRPLRLCETPPIVHCKFHFVNYNKASAP